MNDLNENSAESAFKVFFNTDGSNKPNTHPTVEKIKNKLEENHTLPNKTVNTVDTNQMGPDKSMSVNDAQKVVDRPREFKDVLKELKVNFSDLFTIIDQFLEKGYYEQKYKVKSLEFAFRTKKVRSIDSINDVMDASKYTMPSAAGQLLLERSLASSLVYFKMAKQSAQIFAHDTDEDDEKALEFVKKLTTPIYTILCGKLQKFEMYTGLASREEAIDHFLAHTQD